MSTMQAPRRRATWQDGYAAQMELWAYLRSETGLRSFARWALAETRRSPAKRDVYEALLAAEADKLLLADPYFVSAEMCDVIDSARHDFEPEPLLPTDLLTDFGFAYFERPFYIPDRHGHLVNVKALGWSPMIAAPPEPGVPDPPGVDRTLEHGVALSLYSTTVSAEAPEDPDIAEIEQLQQEARERGLAIPTLTPLHFTPIWFGLDPKEEEVDVDTGLPTGTSHWWKLFQSTLRLMQQQITVRHRERPDRPLRREAARRGWHEREILVVRLRREKGQPSDGPHEDANYSHRFIVSGHWRWQWYPSAKVHRQIRIFPYVKGPEDAPLVIKPRRAFTWDR